MAKNKKSVITFEEIDTRLRAYYDSKGGRVSSELLDELVVWREKRHKEVFSKKQKDAFKEDDYNE